MATQTKNKKVLIVLDMQEVCVGKKHAKIFRYDKDLIDKTNKIIATNDDVVYIRTIMRNNFINRLSPIQVFDGTKNAKLAEELLKKGNIVFDKYKGNAFSNPELLKYLRLNNVGTIELVGVDGGGCVSLTALGAIDNGLNVILNTKAIDTMFKRRQKRYYEILRQKGAVFI